MAKQLAVLRALLSWLAPHPVNAPGLAVDPEALSAQAAEARWFPRPDPEQPDVVYALQVRRCCSLAASQLRSWCRSFSR